MNAEQLKQFISETYDTDAEYPWAKYPSYMVFRHANNKKWFALIMNITRDKLGFSDKEPIASGKETIDVVNVKCEPILIGSLQNEDGIFPAYHMSKTSWITVALDGSVSDEKIKWLLDMSYNLTAKKSNKKP